MKTLLFTIASILLAIAAPAAAQSASSCSAHHAGVDSRGDHVMGFDHEKTTHHFRLTAAGGVIEVEANSDSDTASRDAIRLHLSHIAGMFARGDFDAPMLIHDRIPPGVPILKQKGDVVLWTFAETPVGGRIAITTADPEARAAVYELLRFQIEDHRTGDSPEITDDAKSAAATRPRG